PRPEPSPGSVDPWSPLCPSIADHHGVDERSMRGVCPSSRAGTKLGVCHLRSAILSPLEMQRSVSATFRGVLCHPCASPCLRVCQPMTSTPSPCRETRCARAPPGVAGRCLMPSRHGLSCHREPPQAPGAAQRGSATPARGHAGVEARPLGCVDSIHATGCTREHTDPVLPCGGSPSTVHSWCGRVHGPPTLWYCPWYTCILEGLKRSPAQGRDAWLRGRRRT